MHRSTTRTYGSRSIAPLRFSTFFRLVRRSGGAYKEDVTMSIRVRERLKGIFTRPPYYKASSPLVYLIRGVVASVFAKGLLSKGGLLRDLQCLTRNGTRRFLSIRLCMNFLYLQVVFVTSLVSTLWNGYATFFSGKVNCLYVTSALFYSRRSYSHAVPGGGTNTAVYPIHWAKRFFHASRGNVPVCSLNRMYLHDIRYRGESYTNTIRVGTNDLFHSRPLLRPAYRAKRSLY